MALLEVRELFTQFHTRNGIVRAVNGISFSLDRGQTLGIVGESGSGKSVTAYSILQLLGSTGRILSGSIRFDGQELIGLPKKQLQKLRGGRISIVFQDPMTSLNPTYTVGHQLIEAITLHTHRRGQDARLRAIELLRMVNIPAPEKRLSQYPHALSGGMRQRVMIAMALASEPDILIADEPTTALDVTVQAQILALLQKLQKELGLGILLITHDLGVVAQMCSRVLVMYAGTLCEEGPVEEIFSHPKHAYTRGLLGCVPDPERAQAPLKPIGGAPPDLLAPPPGCPFAPRCDRAMNICITHPCPLEEVGPAHRAACWFNRKEDTK